MADPGPAVGPPAAPSANVPGAAGAEVPAPAVGEATVTHGFLFADLRDYTSYVDTHGDRAGALLLARYRALVREAVATAHGAEIRTEGDSFYVVFGSVGAAVRCGLAIIGAAAAIAADSDPIRVGVGVHAGETVETTEGFVGSAVNVAARLCAAAQAGEVIVSDTVRALTRTSLEVDFEPLGTRRLKGVAEPIAVYRVAPRDATAHAPATHPLGRRPSRLLAAGLGVAALAAVGAIVLLGRGPPAAPTPGPSAAAVAASPAGASPSPGASHSPATSATPGSSQVEGAIMADLPNDLAKTCERGATLDDARLAGFIGITGDGIPVTPRGSRGGVTCHPVAGASRLYVMTPWNEYAVSGTPADEFLGWMVGRQRIPDGSCATAGRAHERWNGPRGTGTLACMNPYQGRPWIYFTFDKGRYLAFATRDDDNYHALYAWWDQLRIFLP